MEQCVDDVSRKEDFDYTLIFEYKLLRISIHHVGNGYAHVHVMTRDMSILKGQLQHDPLTWLVSCYIFAFEITPPT